MATLNGACGQVAAAGTIIRNGNFSCTLYTGQSAVVYTVNYNGSVANGYPVISLEGMGSNQLSYALDSHASGL